MGSVAFRVDTRDNFESALAYAQRDTLLQVAEMYGLGVCDDCDFTYDVADREEHCGDCGSCWEHCEGHTTEEEKA